MLRRIVPNYALKIAIILDGRKAYQIADDAGLAAHILSGYCTGRFNPTEEAKQRLADVLGKTVAELFDDSQSVAAS